MKRTNLFFWFGMILVAVFSQVLPHPANFSPLGAVALFAGVQIADKRAAVGIPLSAAFLCDLLRGWHVLSPFVYGSWVLTVFIGFLLRGQRGFAILSGASILSAAVFFVITNFGNWLVFETYPKTASGLLTCYLAGLPSFRGTLLSQAIYGVLLFGGAALARHVSRPRFAYE